MIWTKQSVGANFTITAEMRCDVMRLNKEIKSGWVTGNNSSIRIAREKNLNDDDDDTLHILLHHSSAKSSIVNRLLYRERSAVPYSAKDKFPQPVIPGMIQVSHVTVTHSRLIRVPVDQSQSPSASASRSPTDGTINHSSPSPAIFTAEFPTAHAVGMLPIHPSILSPQVQLDQARRQPPFQRP